MSDESGIEPRNNSALTALEARMTAAEADIADHETRISDLEAAGSAAQQIYTCPMAAQVRDAVYLSGAGAVDIADATNRSKMPAIGFIASKPTATTCILQDEDELSGFVGLTPGAIYYADPTTPGGITTTKPDPIVDGHVAQQVGIAKSATVLKIEISVPPPVNP